MDDLLMEYEGNKPTTPTERERRRRLAATVTICGLAFVGIGQLSTGAWFTDQGTANVQFATGDVQVSLDNPNALGTSTARALKLPAVNNMAPGDTEYIPIKVDNSGSLRMRYSVEGQSVSIGTSPDLSAVLEYTVNAGLSAASCTATGFGGGTLASVSSNMLLSSTAKAVIGDKNPGTDLGDRELAANDSEWLCVRVSLDKTVTSTYANGKADVTLTFDAIQTANNP